jgi:hypothetical protein
MTMVSWCSALGLADLAIAAQIDHETLASIDTQAAKAQATNGARGRRLVHKMLALTA